MNNPESKSTTCAHKANLLSSVFGATMQPADIGLHITVSKHVESYT